MTPASRQILGSLLVLAILVVHAMAPGSSPYCMMKTAPACHKNVANTAQISAPCCCEDGCVKGVTINLPSSEISPVVMAEHGTAILAVADLVFNDPVVLTSSAKIFESINKSGSPPILSARLARLQIFLI